MTYICLDCGDSFKDTDGRSAYGYLACPNCLSADIELIRDEDNPATCPEDFGIYEGLQEASRCH